MSRIGCALLAVVLGSCGPSGSATPPEPPAERPRPQARATATWKLEQSWTQLRAVSIDGEGRVAVVGHRLVEGDPLRAVGVVQVYDIDGELAWEREIEASWVEGVDVAARPNGGFAALMHEHRDDADESVVYLFAADGSGRGRSNFDFFGRPERPHDLAVGPSGSIAFVTTTGSPAEHAPTAESVAFVLDANGIRKRELPVDGEAVAIAIDGGDNVAIATDRPAMLHVFPPSGDAIRIASAIDHPWDLAPTSGGWMLAGETSDDGAPIVVVDPTGAVVRRAGQADSLVFSIATAGASAYTLGLDGVLAMVDGEADVQSIATAVSDEDELVDLAVGPDGGMAFLGQRHGSPWGRVDPWLVRLQQPNGDWPTPRAKPTKKFIAVPDGDDDARVGVLLRWLDPRGEDPWLPEHDDETGRALARVLLRGPLHCEPWLAESGPDHRAYAPEHPGRHSTLDDPCLRLALLRERMDTLRGEDLDALRRPLLDLLRLHGDRVHDGEMLGKAILDVAFERDRLPQWARATLLDGVHRDVTRAAIDRLTQLGGEEGRFALRDVFDVARCEIASEAFGALLDMGHAPRLDHRSPGMSAETLARRWCVLAHRDRDHETAFWKTFVRGSYDYVETCEGDWPRDSHVFECTASKRRRKDPPTEWLGEFVACDELRCTIGSERFMEGGAPHGHEAILRFERGRDGELYVESVTVTRWFER